MSGKKISNFRGWEKILTQTDLPLRLKSQMVNHIGGGEKEDLTPQQMSPVNKMAGARSSCGGFQD